MSHALARTRSACPTSALHKQQPILLLDVLIAAFVLLLLPCGICFSELITHFPVTMTNVDDLIASLREALAREGQA